MNINYYYAELDIDDLIMVDTNSGGNIYHFLKTYESIKEHGLSEPIHVMAMNRENSRTLYNATGLIVYGGCTRTLCCYLIGNKKIPAIITEIIGEELPIDKSDWKEITEEEVQNYYKHPVNIVKMDELNDVSIRTSDFHFNEGMKTYGVKNTEEARYKSEEVKKIVKRWFN